MGATFWTVHFRREVLPEEDWKKLNREQMIRDSGNGWYRILQKTANPYETPKMLRSIPGYALLFNWVDDDYFFLTLYQNGRKAARIGYEQEAEHIKRFEEFYPDDPQLVKKLKALSMCATVEEGLQLLEETFGLPLYDLPEAKEDDARVVRMSEETFQKILAREASIKNRPNAFRLEEVPYEEWPESMRAARELDERTDHAQHAVLPYGIFSGVAEAVPGRPGWYMKLTSRFEGDPALVVANPDGRFKELRKETGHFVYSLSLLDMRTKERIVQTWKYPKRIMSILYASPDSRIVFINTHETTGCPESIICMDAQGNIRWEFDPATGSDDNWGFTVNIRPDGVLAILYRNITEGFDTIWQISLDDGCILSKREFIASEMIVGLRWLEDLDLYAYTDLKRNVEVLLDKELQEIRAFPFDAKLKRLDTEPVYANGCLWAFGCMQWEGMNLRTGKRLHVKPEIPAYLKGVLSDGTMIGLHMRKQALVVTDAEGRIISQNSVKRTIWNTFISNDTVYVLEDDVPKERLGPSKETKPVLWKAVRK